MEFQNIFCPSPWLHAKIRSNGDFVYCRWSIIPKDEPAIANIKDCDAKTFFQTHMARHRQDMINGNSLKACNDCHVMEKYGKISGRQKQMIKVGIDPERIEQSFSTSTFIEQFKYSADNEGHTRLLPMDWQIDLGNYCNSACLFCSPSNSSKLRTQFHKLGMVNNPTQFNWTDDPDLLDKFMEILEQTPTLRYLHFLGGETFLTPGFRKILKKCVETGLNKVCTIGTTTNLTVWDQELNELLCEFPGFNLGVSIETMHHVNEYLRWPAKQEMILDNLERYRKLSEDKNWTMTIRNTPTLFSVGTMSSLYRYALDNRIGVESCDFLSEPKYFKSSVLPMEHRNEAADRLRALVNEYEGIKETGTFNTRHKDNIRGAVLDDAKSWIKYLSEAPDESYRLGDVVDYLKKMESLRNNKITNYLPNYEKILRPVGY
ncbi:MAG: twitch domain-containing radical SAM protein [Rhodospirillales bacterium]